MALNFPDSPTDGQIFGTFRWEAATSTWVSIRPIGYTGSAGTGIGFTGSQGIGFTGSAGAGGNADNFSAVSVFGRSANSNGTAAAITAGNKQVLARDTNANLEFQTITSQFLRQATLEDSNTTIVLADEIHHGRTIVTLANTTVKVYCSNAVSNYFVCSFIQGNVGVINFTANAGAQVHNLHNHANTAGQYSQVSLAVYRTTGNTMFLLQGETII